MPIKIDQNLTVQKLLPDVQALFAVSAEKLWALHQSWKHSQGAPVFTIRGRYASRAWTEWTQGFQFGSALLQFEGTGDKEFLEMGREGTRQHMAGHVSHMGVHDHGFNNVSTYGNLLRMMREGILPEDAGERQFYELALKVSGAVQAARWQSVADGGGYIYSFNGPHSLFIDTMRSLRSLSLAHQLGHELHGEHDERVSLLGRLVQHAVTTARVAIFYGEGRDIYDVRGRTAQESVFNVNDGRYRCPSTQQGYSPFSTWTRGLGWAVLGFAEQLEFLKSRPSSEVGDLRRIHPEEAIPFNWLDLLERAAFATADYCIAICCADGIPMWDTHAPNLARLGNYLHLPADPFNDWEPVDSSAAAILAQGLLRLGAFAQSQHKKSTARRYWQAGLTMARTLLAEPYLSKSAKHHGLLLHSVYHRPNAWDFIAKGQKIPNGESSMWGDYHLRELALFLSRAAQAKPYLAFFNPGHES